MKNITRLFRILVSSGYINPGDFYSIRLERTEIHLQGKFSSENAKKYMEAGAEFSMCEAGFVYLTKGCIKVILTD
jgi:hypothetical protein